DPKTGRSASTTDPTTWGTFERAISYYRKHGLSGVGFVFTEADPYAGADLDDSRNPETGGIEPWAQEIISELGSYAEVSPSGTGVRGSVGGRVPPGGGRKGRFELYAPARFFGLRGRGLKQSAKKVLRRQKALAPFHARLFPPPEVNDPGTHKHDGRLVDLTDE